MKVLVEALPIQAIIADLAKQWQVEIKEESGELTIQMPEDVGEGIIRGTSFGSGMGIIEYQGTFYIDTEIVFCINDIHPLKFIFCSQGKVKHFFAEDQEVHLINTFQNVIVSSSGKNGHVLKFPSNETVHVTSIEIRRPVFSHRNNFQFYGLSRIMKSLFNDTVAEEKFIYQG